MDRVRKFRQAAMYYVLVGIVYEAAVYVAWREGFAPEGRGPVWLWLAVGALVLGAIVWGLWSWRSVLLARLLAALNGLRVFGLLAPAFVPTATRGFSPAFYQLEVVLVLVNIWMLARAGWDL